MTMTTVDMKQTTVISKKLADAIEDVVSGFMKTKDGVIKAFEVGRAEGLTDKEIGLIIKTKMLEAGFDSRHVRRVLPSTAKGNQGRASPKNKDKVSDFSDFSDFSYQMEANEYDIKAVEQYDRVYLIKVVRYLHNELIVLSTEIDAMKEQVTILENGKK